MHRNKFALGWIAFLAAFSIAWDFAPEPEANKPTGQISFTLKDTRNVRDDRLQLKGRAKAGGKVTIDPKFLLKYFGTETPSIRQLRNLLFIPSVFPSASAPADILIPMQNGIFTNTSSRSELKIPMVPWPKGRWRSPRRSGPATQK